MDCVHARSVFQRWFPGAIDDAVFSADPGNPGTTEFEWADADAEHGATQTAAAGFAA
jgi:hypothetical protein